MKCKYPVLNEKKLDGTRFSYQHRCGRCLPCNIQRRKEWTARMMLETIKHRDLTFVTLTYDDDHVPISLSPVDAVPLGNLRKSDLQDYFKRLRKAGLRFRYYACGEYGENTERPHYHAILFGVSPFDEELLIEKWPHGHVQVREFTPQRAGYVASYTSKKLQFRKKNHDGRAKEFSLMSRKPGIGFDALDFIAETIRKHDEVLDDDQIVLLFNGHFRANGKIWPLDSECRKRLHNKFVELGLLPERTDFAESLEGHHSYWDKFINRDQVAEIEHKLKIEQAERKHAKFSAMSKHQRL